MILPLQQHRCPPAPVASSTNQTCVLRREGVAAVRGVGGEGQQNPVAAIAIPPPRWRMDLANTAGGLFLRLAADHVLLVSQVRRQYCSWLGKAAWLCCRMAAWFKNRSSEYLWKIIQRHRKSTSLSLLSLRLLDLLPVCPCSATPCTSDFSLK